MQVINITTKTHPNRLFQEKPEFINKIHIITCKFAAERLYVKKCGR